MEDQKDITMIKNLANLLSIFILNFNKIKPRQIGQLNKLLSNIKKDISFKQPA
jgi:hypothetical protein